MPTSPPAFRASRFLGGESPEFRAHGFLLTSGLPRPLPPPGAEPGPAPIAHPDPAARCGSASPASQSDCPRAGDPGWGSRALGTAPAEKRRDWGRRRAARGPARRRAPPGQPHLSSQIRPSGRALGAAGVRGRGLGVGKESHKG